MNTCVTPALLTAIRDQGDRGRAHKERRIKKNKMKNQNNFSSAGQHLRPIECKEVYCFTSYCIRLYNFFPDCNILDHFDNLNK